jgi:hypothetical protein
LEVGGGAGFLYRVGGLVGVRPAVAAPNRVRSGSNIHKAAYRHLGNGLQFLMEGFRKASESGLCIKRQMQQPSAALCAGRQAYPGYLVCGAVSIKGLQALPAAQPHSIVPKCHTRG